MNYEFDGLPKVLVKNIFKFYSKFFLIICILIIFDYIVDDTFFWILVR